MRSPGRSRVGASAVAVALALGACLTPPAIRGVGREEVPLEAFPAGSSLVEIPAGRDAVLRGVYTPGAEDGLLVVHFLPSGTSLTTGFPSGEELLPYLAVEELSARGHGSLVVDYSGVGASDGEPDPFRLREDAEAIYREALSRVRGDESRIVLRAMSIGTLAAAHLLGAHPEVGAGVLFAPVRGETVATHWLDSDSIFRFWGHLDPPTRIAWRLLLDDAGDVDLVECLEATDAPLLVVFPGSDQLLPTDERRLVEHAVAGARIELLGEDHHETCRTALRLQPAERELYDLLAAAPGDVVFSAP